MVIDLETRQPLEQEGKFNEPRSLGDGGESHVSSKGGVPSYLLNNGGPTANENKPTNLPPGKAIKIGEVAQKATLPVMNEVVPVGLANSSSNASAPNANSNPILFTSLLEEITLPMLQAEAETRKANRTDHFQGDKGKWEPKELKPRHREIMRRILEGATYLEIAEEMGLSQQSVMLVSSSAMFKEELNKLDSELNLNVIRRAEELSNEALDRLKILMRRARSEGLQARCAESVLGIAGYSKIEKKQVSVISGDDVIRELNRRRRESAGINSGEATQFSSNGNSRPASPRSDSSSISEAELTSPINS